MLCCRAGPSLVTTAATPPTRTWRHRFLTGWSRRSSSSSIGSTCTRFAVHRAVRSRRVEPPFVSVRGTGRRPVCLNRRARARSLLLTLRRVLGGDRGVAAFPDVNVQNVVPEVHNPKDPVGGFQGIPVNMTGMAEHLKAAGYRTHLVGVSRTRYARLPNVLVCERCPPSLSATSPLHLSLSLILPPPPYTHGKRTVFDVSYQKWDAGMATELHSPRARGYDSWLGCKDLWREAHIVVDRDVRCGVRGLRDAPNDGRNEASHQSSRTGSNHTLVHSLPFLRFSSLSCRLAPRQRLLVVR